MSVQMSVGDAPLPRVADRPDTITLFSVVLFASAFLLFVLEPMVAKALLPKLGGTPQVWNTCMVFFQTTLLAGYVVARRNVRPGTESSKPLDAMRTDPWQRLKWVTLAFIPSSLMLGVTTYITT